MFHGGSPIGTSTQNTNNEIKIIIKSFIIMNEFISNKITISDAKIMLCFQLPNIYSSFLSTTSCMGHGPIFM